MRSDAFDHADGSLRAHYVLVAVLFRYESSEPLAADHAAEAGWFLWSRISSGAMPLSKDVESIADRCWTDNLNNGSNVTE